MEVPSYRSIVKGAGIFGAAKAVNILTALVRTKFAAVLLGTAGVGLNALFNTVQLFMNQLLGLGLSTGSVKTLSEAYSTHDLAFIDQHVTRVRHWAILCGAAAIVLLALLSPLLSLLYFDTLHYVPHFMLLGVGVAALIVCDIEQSVMRSLQRSVRLAFSMLLTAICALVFTVPFYWWLGIRGVIFAIVRKDALGKVSRHIPTMLDYRTHIDKESMFNTPPVLPIFVMNETLKWLKGIGGVEAIQKVDQAKAELLYAEIDRNRLFTGTAAKEDRSCMNVCFVMAPGYEALEGEFMDFAKGKGMMGIKGHRSVGGFRASIYNACTLEDVQALTDCMKEFESLKK